MTKHEDEKSNIGLELPEDLKWDLEFTNDTDFRKVINYSKVIDIYKREINNIQSKCNHAIYESHFYNNGKLVVAGGISPCPKCNLRIEGWYCPASKNHKCSYTKSNDMCDYCGHPDERK